ncbi:hypothetical protein PLEOSDRAFT_1050560, partial [Pleurotus ostreatus PC15]
FIQRDVFDCTCNVVDGLTTNLSACTQGIFACIPSPVTFNGYTSTLSGLRLVLRCDSSTAIISTRCYTCPCI